MEKRMLNKNFWYAPVIGSRLHLSHGFNEEIKNAILENDFKKFQASLVEYLDPEAIDKHCNDYRLIDQLASEIGKEIYLQEVIFKFKDVINKRNKVTKRYAIHYAADVGNTAAIKLLLESGADVNVQDLNGDTPLHVVVHRWDSSDQTFGECLDLLLSWPELYANIPNNLGFTPIHLAAALEKEPVVRKILKLESSELDVFRCLEENRTAREEIKKTFPDIDDELPQEALLNAEKISDYKYKLFYYLTMGQELKFCKTLRDALGNQAIQREVLLACQDYEQFSYLQRACQRGLPQATRLLIKSGADVNFCEHNMEPPIAIAARNGFYDILSILLVAKDINIQPNELGETILHIFVSSRKSESDCVDCIRKIVSQTNINICEQDCKGRTALHIAAKNGDENSIFALLDLGAKPDIANNFGETPLNFLSQSTLRKYLDSKIMTNGHKPKDCDFQIILDYQHLQNNNHIYGVSTSILCHMSEIPELKSLLAHPIYSTVIFFKWIRIRMFFYLNLLFFTAFCFYMTTYIYFGSDLKTAYASCDEEELENALENNITCSTLFAGEQFDQYHTALLVFAFIFLIMSLLMEMVQVLGSPISYCKDPENWCQLGVILCSFLVIKLDCAISPSGHNFCPQLSALTLLLVWVEFFFAIGNHPRLTFFVGMFRTGSLSLFQFIIVHVPLIFGFALTFHVLFRNEDNQFSSVHSSFFKTLVMITGEFDYGTIPFETYPIFSRIIFSSFIFLISLVLFNLLIGLAVSATRPIENDTFLFSCISQIPIILFYEDLFYNDKNFFKSWLSFFCRCFKKRLPGNYKSPILYVYPNQKNRMELHYVSQDADTLEDGFRVLHLRNRLGKKIVSDLHLMITNEMDSKRENCDKMDNLIHCIECFRESHEQETRNIMKALVDILEILKDCGNADGIQTKYLSKQQKGEKKKRKSSGLKIGTSLPFSGRIYESIVQ